jgi:DNA processing protein
MASIPKVALIAHIITTQKLLKPKQLVFALKHTKSFEMIWEDPWILTPHIIRPEHAQIIENIRNSSALQREYALLEKHDIRLCAYGDALYPKLLTEIHSPPMVLYYRGTMQSKDFTLAVIGSRKVSEYGKEAIASIVAGFSGLSMSIISGLALGADAAAHYAALQNGLHTIGVLGSGIDDASIYPRSHITLAQHILDAGGALISEYPPGTPARPEHFPMRNRIIAGMSRAVLVAEAAGRSGTLITAHAALDGGRDVWAVPGSIFSALSSGTNQLISEGANVAQSSETIIEHYAELHTVHAASAQDILQKIIQEEQLLI